MLSLLLRIVKPKQSAEQVIADIQAGRGDKEEFLRQYQPFVRKTVSTVCKRYISEQDDEYSIGLFAFHQAVEQYSYKKGKSFFAFAELLIKRDVIDYIRREVRHNVVFLQEEQQGETPLDMRRSMEEYGREMESENRKEEILHFQGVLSEFGVSMTDLVKESPKHQDTREHLFQVAELLIAREELVAELFQKKRLPMKKLEGLVRVSRKTLERHRRYLVALCIILTGEYMYIKEYMKGVMGQ
ncbi:RNA polymerase sigma-I factor [Ectobacillus ponti]|uniref:RNA polymerase sigma factor SigI n=1 Tax=Ectobacillus ponti TaxID=2961894 RepID=A0AA41X633_9BACI|nr:RNA polymerase sigma-I factor [Ectobacillus ponti]